MKKEMILIKKYIDELKEIQEKNDYEKNEIKKNENELNEKNKIIENLKNEKNEIIKKKKKNDEINKKLTKENNELKNEIEKLTKSNIKFSGLPTLFQDIVKKNNKAKTFAPADIDKEIDEKKEYLNINLSDVDSFFNTVKKIIEKKNYRYW